MHVIFVNRYFYPDTSATSQILSDLAFYLAGDGYDIHIVTSRSNYTDNTISYDKDEAINNLTIHRIWTTRFGRSNLIGRAFDYLSFYVSSLCRLLLLVRKTDVVIVKTDPPMISIVVYLVCFLKRAIYINWLQDLFPEVGEELGVRALSGKLGKIVRLVRNISLKSAFHNVVIGEKMSDLVKAEGIKSDKITTIHNWSDVNILNMSDSDVNALRKKWGIDEKFIVGYSGNFGRAHDYQTISDVVSKLRDNQQIVFLFIGGGLYYEQLKCYVECKNISNVVFKPYQPRENLAESLSVPDVHLVSLIPSLEGLIVPSKYYGIAAVGKSAIFIGDKEGEIANILHKYNCGLVIESGHSDLLAEAILNLKSNTDQLMIYGNNAYKVFESTYTKEISQKKWEDLLHRATVH